MDSGISLKTEARPNNVRLVSVTGRLDAKTAKEFTDCCQLLRGQGCRHLIINLSAVSFVASSGVGTLLALSEEMKDVGGEFHLVALSETVASVLRLLKLMKFLSIAASEDEALDMIRS